MSRIVFVAILLLALESPGIAEPCNPVIDGTYCATNMGPRPGTARSPKRFTPIGTIGDDISTGRGRWAASHSGGTGRDASVFCAGAAAAEWVVMRTTHSIAAAAALLAGFVASSVPARAQETKDRVVEQYTCKDVMRESGVNRDVVIAFLHGFLLGKSGSSKFNVDALRKESDDFIERCLDNPGEKAVDALRR